jgi:multiple sugar transport system substrate-binding protein
MTGLGQMQFWVDTYNPVPLDKGVLPETYQTQFLGAGTARDGVTYLAPAQISAPVMAVNQDLLDAAGAGDAEDIKTYEDLLDVARQVSDHTGKPSVSIAPSGLPEWYTQGLVQNSGGTLVNEDGTAAFGDSAGIAALDIWSDLGRDGLEAGIPAASEAVDIFTSGTLPITMITTSNIASISQGVGDKFDWMPIKLPSIDGVRDRALPAGGNGYMVLSDDSCRAAFSGELIGQILTPESVMQASGTQRSYIPVDTIARDELLASDQASPQMTFAWTFDNELTQWGGGFPGAHTAKIYDAIELMDQQLQTGADTATAVQDAVVTIDAIVLGENS